MGASAYGGCGVYGGPRSDGGSGPSGSGTLNYIAKWTPDGTTLGNSQLFDNGTNVGLGTTTMAHYFDVVKAQDDVTTVNITNSNTGTSSSSRFRLFNGTSSSVFQHFGSSYTTSNANFQNGLLISAGGAGGLSIVTSNASGDLRFYIGQATAITARFLASNGNFGLGISPTAVLHLKAGTATASTAPLKFTSGTNLATPEAGAMEYNGTELYWTPGSTRLTLLSNRGGLDNIITGKNVANTTFTGDSNIIYGTTFATGLTTGYDNVLIGRGASSALTSGVGNVIIGCGIANPNVSGVIAMGQYVGLASGLSSNSVMIGNQVNFAGTLATGQVIMIGAYGQISAGSVSNSMGLGYRHVISAANQLVIGSSSTNEMFTEIILFGSESSSVDRATQKTMVLRCPSMYSNTAVANLVAHNFHIKGSLSTGNAATGGNIEFYTTNNGASGTTLNSYVKRGSILGTTGYWGIGNITPAAFLDINAGTTAAAQIRLRAGVAPSSPNDGDIYYVDTNDRFMVRKNTLDSELLSASAVTTESVASDTTLTITYNGAPYKLLARA